MSEAQTGTIETRIPGRLGRRPMITLCYVLSGVLLKRDLPDGPITGRSMRAAGG